MSRNTKYTEAKRERSFKEGRGQGHWKNYKPFIVVQNINSTGRVSRPYSLTSHRKHQFFSKLETDFFYMFDWFDNVIDIREQFPLQRETTLSIAEEINIRHPKDPFTNVYIDLTTDFLLTVLDSEKRHIYEAYSVKPSSELNNQNSVLVCN